MCSLSACVDEREREKRPIKLAAAEQPKRTHEKRPNGSHENPTKRHRGERALSGEIGVTFVGERRAAARRAVGRGRDRSRVAAPEPTEPTEAPDGFQTYVPRRKAGSDSVTD